MTVYGLTVTQRALCDQVGAAAGTLHEQLRELQQHTWRGAASADIDAVREWLIKISSARSRVEG